MMLFLAGGGSATDSLHLDTAFAAQVDKRKSLIYIPLAASPHKRVAYTQWFRGVFEPLGITRISVWEELPQDADLDDIGGVYIGGGDTGHLLDALRKTGLFEVLISLVHIGVPVYGGSAGAIVLGSDIRSSPEVTHDQRTRGLNVIAEHAVYCHLTSLSLALSTHRRLDCPVIALTERSGAIVDGTVLRCVGFDPVTVFHDGRAIDVLPGDTLNLEEDA